MVVTKAPSEPFSVVADDTEGDARPETVPHDTWLADEDPSPETLDWCRSTASSSPRARAGPTITGRAGRGARAARKATSPSSMTTTATSATISSCNSTPTTCQSPAICAEMLRPFADPAVGYVSAPSICDRNAAESWSARGRLYAEASMHGSLQAGYNGGLAPLCIGSHYAVRTAALKEIGGLGPELAEDHSTTLMMNAYGWRGVHALDAIAHGDGPRTFADLVTQEFQWSRSLVMLLLTVFAGLRSEVAG